jgi:1-deoxy-D-xylulose-5-phosphate reductoisomerase
VFSSRPSVALLGATGSVGTQTLDVLRAEDDGFELVALAGGRRLSELAAIAHEFHVKRIGVVTESDRDTLLDSSTVRSTSWSAPTV